METTLGRYRMGAKLGEGGMGVVWRAHDPRLGRDVALKVLPDALVADPEARERLLREARAAAALNHPNILTVYDVGEADGHVYLAMEYVPGRPLSEIIPGDGLPVTECVRLGVQISAALAHAHEHGVVHRDIKPSNVLVTPAGDAKVLDFGIATRVVSDDSNTIAIDLTQPGALVGTPGAMAPELWRGARADLRSDVWAFGALMYTMLAGAAPYQGRTAFELSTAICTTDPLPLPDRVPNAVRGLVARCLEHEPARRYRSAMEVHAALQAIAAGAAPDTATAATAPTPPPVAAEPPRTRRGARVALAIGVALAVVAGAALLVPRWLGRGARRPIASLAVLPLDNLSHDADQQYFADGMTEELITRVAQLGIVRVISRTSVMRFRGATLALPEIARQLGVDAIVEGSVEQSGGHVRISAQLVRAATDEHLWARSYEREVGDALALQDEVAEAIAHELRGTLAPATADPALASRAAAAVAHAPPAPVRPAALEAYLRGRDQYERWSTKGNRRALQYFDQALALDSTFAAAMASRGVMLFAVSSAPETVAMARAAFAKALAVAPDVGEAHAALAKFLFEHDWNWVESEREFRRAIELNPNDADAHHHYSHLLAALGRVPEAREQARIMIELDPLAPASYHHMAWLEGECGNLEAADAQHRKVVELDPDYEATYVQMADAALAARRWAVVRQSLEDARTHGVKIHPALFGLVTAAEQGRREDGVRLVPELAAYTGDLYTMDWPSIASWYVAFGRRDAAFAMLDSAFVNHSYALMFANLDPGLAELRGDPRYRALRRRMRLPL